VFKLKPLPTLLQLQILKWCSSHHPSLKGEQLQGFGFTRITPHISLTGSQANQLFVAKAKTFGSLTLIACIPLSTNQLLVSLFAREAAVPYQPLKSPAAWYASQMRNQETEWCYRLTPEDVAELEAAVDYAVASGKDIKVLGGVRAWQ
jgi:hypothetical protein